MTTTPPFVVRVIGAVARIVLPIETGARSTRTDGGSLVVDTLLAAVVLGRITTAPPLRDLFVLVMLVN